MSDMHRLTQKTREGKEWRGTITVEDDGDELELTIRNLVSPEIEEVFRKIDRDELETLRDELPKDKMDERRELLEMDEDERSDEDDARLETLNEELRGEHMKLFDILSSETFEGIRLAAKYGVVPDQDDMEDAVLNRAREIEKERGIQVQQPEDTFDYLKDELVEVVEESTDFMGFQLGMKVLRETGDDEGNSET